MPDWIWLLALVIAASAVILALLSWSLGRLRKFLKDSSAFRSSPDWTIEQINELHKSGQLTDKQYRVLRDAVIRNMQKSQR